MQRVVSAFSLAGQFELTCRWAHNDCWRIWLESLKLKLLLIYPMELCRQSECSIGWCYLFQFCRQYAPASAADFLRLALQPNQSTDSFRSYCWNFTRN